LEVRARKVLKNAGVRDVEFVQLEQNGVSDATSDEMDV